MHIQKSSSIVFMQKLFFVGLLMAILPYFGAAAQDTDTTFLPSPKQSSLIEVQVEVDNPYYMPTGEENFIYLYVSAKAAKYPVDKKNTPLNLSLVLDRSGSMSGAKLKYAREASKIVIDHLGENDQLSIIAYDHEIEVMQPSLRITSNKTRKQLKRKIDAIFHNGSTNLGGGMLEGFKEVSEYYKDDYVNRVLLLSDGLANKGIIDPEILKDTARYFNQRQNISLSTFGLGADFDEDLMEGLSVFGGANYYFIDKAVKVPQILLRELQILQHVVSQKEHLKVFFPKDILRLEKAFGLPVVKEKEGQVTIPFSNMFAEEEKAVLLKFLVSKHLQKPLEIPTYFSYRGIVNHRFDEAPIQTEKSIKIIPASSLEQCESSVNKLVGSKVALYEGNAVFRDAIEAVDDHKINYAIRLLNKNLTYLSEQINDFEENPALLQLQKYNEAYLNQLNLFEELSKYELKILQKATKNEYYSLMKLSL